MSLRRIFVLLSVLSAGASVVWALPTAASGSAPSKAPDAAGPPPKAPDEPSPPRAAFTLRGKLLTPDGAPASQAVVYLETGSPAPIALPPVPKDSLIISQRGARFRPEFSVAVVGQTVELPNDDRIVHNVFSVSPVKKFDLGHYGQGERRSVRFERSGIVELFCNIHETMQGVIVVVPSALFSLVAADGSFSIPNPPAGAYQIVGYARGGAQVRKPITLADSGPAELVLTLNPQ